MPGAGTGKYTYVTAIIPEANYTADIAFSTSGKLDGSKINFNGFGLIENATIHTDGTSDGTTVALKGISKTLDKTDLSDATVMQDTLMKEVNNSNIALGSITTTGSNSNVEVVVPTRKTMPEWKIYRAHRRSLDREHR